MLSTYEDYQSEPFCLTFEEMVSMHKEMKEETGRNKEALELYKELLAAAVRYSESRSNWPLWDREKKMAEDSVRTSRHNKVIDTFNILARYLKKQGKAAAWRDMLGEDRKRIGDFACYIVFAESTTLTSSLTRRAAPWAPTRAAWHRVPV